MACEVHGEGCKHGGRSVACRLDRMRPEVAAMIRADLAAARGGAAGPGAEPALPTLADQLGNLAAAVVRNARGGAPRVDAAERAARLAICHGCDRFRKSDHRCAACGCKVKAKSALALEDCPRGYWAGARGDGPVG